MEHFVFVLRLWAVGRPQFLLLLLRAKGHGWFWIRRRLRQGAKGLEADFLDAGPKALGEHEFGGVVFPLVVGAVSAGTKVRVDLTSAFGVLAGIVRGVARITVGHHDAATHRCGGRRRRTTRALDRLSVFPVDYQIFRFWYQPFDIPRSLSIGFFHLVSNLAAKAVSVSFSSRSHIQAHAEEEEEEKQRRAGSGGTGTKLHCRIL
mmetsp:Transcript_1602/g.2793  ORF Transcript_1602/g.2793 Transcript_1602/m.2793 type:complete len:205 (+) Transcript_1602:2033-2647(+)